LAKRGNTSKKQKAFRLRLQGETLKAIAQELKVSANTISRWEKGWIDGRGRKHRGWLAELEKVKEESESEEYTAGLALKRERLKAYDELAQLAIEKVKECFPNITAKTPADVKALISEVRELGRLIAMERGQLQHGGQTVVAIKNDIPIEELSQRYHNATVLPEPERKE
jgi:transcriptional regulator with XRE-family HTH domain